MSVHKHGQANVLTLCRFQQFEQQADVQMLAMMSCVLSTPQEKTVEHDDDSQKPAFPFQHLSRPSSYYPSLEVAISLSRASIETSPRKAQDTISTMSSANASFSDQLAMSYENNAPLGRTATLPKNPRRDSQTASLSTSPEQHRHYHRSNSNLSALAASFTRPFSLSNSAASSPPHSFPKKRVSPSGSYLGATASSVNWASTGAFGRAPTVKEDSARSNLSSISDTEEEVAPRTSLDTARTSDFTSILKNQGHFHDEGHAHFDFLDSSDEQRFATFREAYAELMHVWMLPIARCELLKYNDSQPPSQDRPYFDKAIPSIRGLPAESTRTSLAFKRNCTICAFISEADTSVNRCPNCVRTLRPISCFFCNTFIHGLASPCLHCGHVLHHACRQAVNEAGIKECVSGCGCICSDHPVIEVSRPATRRRDRDSERDVSPAVTIIADAGAQERETASWKGSEWEEMAYESLSRTLRRERRGSEKIIKERVSQIWRGGSA